MLVDGPRKHLHHVAFAVEDGSLPDRQRHLEGLGVAFTDAPGSVAGDGRWFGDADGNRATLREGGLARWRSFGDVRMNIGDHVRRVDQACWQSTGDKPAPRRLGHVLIFTSDLARSEDFYGRRLPWGGRRRDHRRAGGIERGGEPMEFSHHVTDGEVGRARARPFPPAAAARKPHRTQGRRDHVAGAP